MREHRWAPLSVLALAAVLGAWPQAFAQEAQWQGILRCGLIPGVTTKRLVEPLTLTVQGNHAQYTRRIHQTDVAAYSTFVEQGDGTVGPDGALTLRGGGIGKGFQYTATYSGVLPPNGTAARFTGVQLWTTRRVTQVQRECSIELAR